MKIKIKNDCKFSLNGYSVVKYSKDEVVNDPSNNLLSILNGNYDVINEEEKKVAKKKTVRKAK